MPNKIIKCLLLSVLVLSFSGPLLAQSRKIIMGSVVEKNENNPVPLASITNITLGKTIISRGNGTFELEAATGHIIAYSANGFYADTISLKADNYESASVLLVLRPLPSTLTTVTVVGKYNAYQIDSIERRKSFMEDVGENKMPTVSKATDMGFGVGINLDRWSKKEKSERKARNMFEVMEEEAYVNYRWNLDLVSKYTTYEGDTLIIFIQKNRPEYQWLRKNPDEDALVYYINTALKKEKRKKK